MTKKNNFLDFLIVGAAKSGTTALHEYLDKHPDVFLPAEKELYFWQVRANPNQAIVRHFEGRKTIPQTLEAYQANYEAVKLGQKVGEATPSYLYYHKYTIQSLSELYPQPEQIKIIIILRDPVDRIISQYRFVKKLGLDPEDLNLEDSLDAEEGRRQQNVLLPDLFYQDVSRYASQVAAYKNYFDSVKVVLYDELKKDAGGLCEQLCSFIGVDPEKLPVVGNEIHNQSKTRTEVRTIAKKISKVLGPFWRIMPEGRVKESIRHLAFVERPNQVGPVSANVMLELYQTFLPELDELELVTGLDLADWKDRYQAAIDDLS